VKTKILHNKIKIRILNMESLVLSDIKDKINRKSFNFNYIYNKNKKKIITVRINKAGSGMLLFTRKNLILKPSKNMKNRLLKDLKSILRIFDLDVYVMERFESYCISSLLTIRSFRLSKALITKSLEKIKNYELLSKFMQNDSKKINNLSDTQEEKDEMFSQKAKLVDTHSIIHSFAYRVIN